MILFNKSTATTGRNSKHVCTVKTTSCRLFIFRFIRPKQLSARKKKRGAKTHEMRESAQNKNKSCVLWSLASVENINLHVLWQFWFNLRRHATHSGAEYMVLLILQLSFILRCHSANKFPLFCLLRFWWWRFWWKKSQPNWESSFSHFTFQQQHKKYRFS